MHTRLKVGAMIALGCMLFWAQISRAQETFIIKDPDASFIKTNQQAKAAIGQGLNTIALDNAVVETFTTVFPQDKFKAYRYRRKMKLDPKYTFVLIDACAKNEQNARVIGLLQERGLIPPIQDSTSGESDLAYIGRALVVIQSIDVTTTSGGNYSGTIRYRGNSNYQDAGTQSVSWDSTPYVVRFSKSGEEKADPQIIPSKPVRVHGGPYPQQMITKEEPGAEAHTIRLLVQNNPY